MGWMMECVVLANLEKNFKIVGSGAILLLGWLLLGASSVLVAVNAMLECCQLHTKGLCHVFHIARAQQCFSHSVAQGCHEVQCCQIFSPVLKFC